MGSHYASVKRLTPSRLWPPVGKRSSPEGRKAEKRSFSSEARSAEREKEELTVSYGNEPSVIDACGLCLGLNLSTDA